ncbi:hypothetical protein BDW02DRAFT_577447 [Decorospora gaudefroyi]|uniref:L-ornithine N(5)-monooxygenase [NAD(P)H] n=1 Tax=Decorospora gaudefroyi TaxID=184978 RepID=A0A6A5KMA3_9PLEO|nr:hypothetical protein BDW02DRAFT_577447 [Decorospora gaudefroyi]
MSPHADMLPESPGAPAVQPPFTSFLSSPLVSAPENRSHLRYTPVDELHDLICVGFGPASLAIGVALHDALDGSDASLVDIPGLQGRAPKVAFLEKQGQFSWHAGMLLPGAKMQISFMKDMATMRNPRSDFTFVNYLHSQGRLVEFANLHTFLPARVEYEDYMKWCAAWFDDVVSYGQEVVQVVPEQSAEAAGQVGAFKVVSRNARTGMVETRRARHVVIAVGGRAHVPAPFPAGHARVVHSSMFSYLSKEILAYHEKPYRVAVVGNGQSAAEIFDFLHANYPASRTNLLIKGGALRPSDDSPFVNEIFNPSRTDCTYARDPTLRTTTLLEDKGTNYGVVRLPLLEHIYETLYMQRIRHGNTPADETHWPHRILPYRRVTAVTDTPGGLRLEVEDASPLYLSDVEGGKVRQEVLDVDVVFVATGYRRDVHEELLRDAKELMPAGGGDKWQVGRDYRVRFGGKSVSSDAGVWLQGCCEGTHGLSDTLLSVLATRGGEIVRSIFDKPTVWDGDVLSV